MALAPFALVIREHPVHWSARGVAAILYLVFFGSIVGYSAYAYALDRLPVAIVSIYPYINAMVAVSLGWLFYREPFGFREAAAMAVIFTGVGIVKWTAASSFSPVTLPPVARRIARDQTEARRRQQPARHCPPRGHKRLQHPAHRRAG